MEAEHQVRVVALGAGVPDDRAAGGWIEPPMRPRPMLDRQGC